MIGRMPYRDLTLFDDWIDLSIRGIHTRIAQPEGYQNG